MNQPTKTLLCPIDFSERSDECLEQAAVWAKTLGAKLHVVHAFQNPVYVLPMSGYVGPQADAIVRMRERCESELKRACGKAEASGVPASYSLVEGIADREILACAKRVSADLIVIGTHGHTGIAHVLLGSVAERVVRHADCPVLVLRSKRAAPAT